jgi:hypothetical protein
VGDRGAGVHEEPIAGLDRQHEGDLDGLAAILFVAAESEASAGIELDHLELDRDVSARDATFFLRAVRRPRR